MAGVGTSGVVDRVNTSLGVATGLVADPGDDVAGGGVAFVGPPVLGTTLTVDGADVLYIGVKRLTIGE